MLTESLPSCFPDVFELGQAFQEFVAALQRTVQLEY
jgi:hypothetical protein